MDEHDDGKGNNEHDDGQENNSEISNEDYISQVWKWNFLLACMQIELILEYYMISTYVFVLYFSAHFQMS